MPEDKLFEFEKTVSDLRTVIPQSNLELLAAFDLYCGEARFGRLLVDADLRRLGRRAKILEVGAGALMLSCVLHREGYDITALEPTSIGFSHFTQLQEIVLDYARRGGEPLKLVRSTAEAFDLRDVFDFAFSINVMEHVSGLSKALIGIYEALKVGGIYRFVCPNYAFPYEPHFNLPTFFSRKLTEKLLMRRILASNAVDDPAGIWASLNWITVSTVRRICRRELLIEPKFRADIFTVYLGRMIADPDFRLRRGPAITKFILALRSLKLWNLARLIPVAILPVMDCTITRAASKAMD